jgi:hypothetical protein
MEVRTPAFRGFVGRVKFCEAPQRTWKASLSFKLASRDAVASQPCILVPAADQVIREVALAGALVLQGATNHILGRDRELRRSTAPRRRRRRR